MVGLGVRARVQEPQALCRAQRRRGVLSSTLASREGAVPRLSLSGTSRDLLVDSQQYEGKKKGVRCLCVCAVP